MIQHTSPAYLELLNQVSLEEIYTQQTFEYYQQRYEECEEKQEFVKYSARIPDEFRDHDFIGVCDRTLGTKIPKARTLDGGAMRGTLQTVGLLLPTGSELFRGCIIFPEIDDKGKFVSAIGYRFGERVRHWQPPVVQWEKPEFDSYVKSGLDFVKEVIYGKAYH
jgi:hypothetical protein